MSQGTATARPRQELGSQRSRQYRRNPLWLLRHLVMGDADNVVAESSQPEIAIAIVLKSDFATVVSIAVGFDNQMFVAPAEIDLQVSYADIDFRRRKAVSCAEPQKKSLQLAAGPIRGRIGSERNPEQLSLPDCPPQLLLRDRTGLTARQSSPPKV